MLTAAFKMDIYELFDRYPSDVMHESRLRKGDFDPYKVSFCSF